MTMIYKLNIQKHSQCVTLTHGYLVVWNPWIEKAKGMGDFGDEEYNNMVCVEVGSVADWVKVGGGETWTGGQVITAL